MFTQQFAFQSTGRCRRLVLVATMPGVIMVPGDGELLEEIPTRLVRMSGIATNSGGLVRDAPPQRSPWIRRAHARSFKRKVRYADVGIAHGLAVPTCVTGDRRDRPTTFT